MYIHTSSRYKRSLCGYQEQSQHLTAWQETPEASVLFLLSLALLMTSKEMLIYRDDVEPVARIMRNFGHIFHHSCFWDILTNHDTYRTNTWNDISNDTYEAPMSVRSWSLIWMYPSHVCTRWRSSHQCHLLAPGFFCCWGCFSRSSHDYTYMDVFGNPFLSSLAHPTVTTGSEWYAWPMKA